MAATGPTFLEIEMDIVERLRYLIQPLDTCPGVMTHPVAAEAADEIERLRHELFGLQTQLQTKGYERQLDDLTGQLATVTAERDALSKAYDVLSKTYDALAKVGADKGEGS